MIQIWVLPSPIKNNIGEYVTKIADINCTLLKWVDGEQKQFVPTVNDAECVGELIGKLHKQSSFCPRIFPSKQRF